MAEQVIFFTEGSTEKASQGWLAHSKDDKFSLLSLPTGHGKTAIAVRTVGLLADQIGEDVGIYLIAPKAKIEEESWAFTINQYREYVKDNVYLHTEMKPDILGNANKHDSIPNKEWQHQAKMKNKETVIEYLKKQHEKGNKITYKQAIKEAFYNKDPVRWQSLRDARLSLKKDILPLFKPKKGEVQKPIVIVIDEVHMFKNPKSNRGKALSKLTKWTKSFGLTATPMSNGLFQDGVGYLVYNGYYTSYSACQKEHVSPRHLDRYYRPDIYLSDGSIDPNRFKYLDEFIERIDQTIYMPNIPIDFDIPEIETTIQRYRLSDATIKKIGDFTKQYNNREYESHGAYLSDVKGAIGSDIDHRRALVRILIDEEKEHKRKGTRLVQPLVFYDNNRELGDDPKQMFDDMIVHFRENKGVELNPKQRDALYQKILDSEKLERGILWSLAKLGKRYGMINGKYSRKTLDVSDPDRVLVIQYKAGGAGIEFTKSNLSIFYGVQYSWQDTEQAIGRNVRRGQDHIVRNYFILSDSPHDYLVWEKLMSKKAFTERAKVELADQLPSDATSYDAYDVLAKSGKGDQITSEEEELLALEIAKFYEESADDD